MASPGASMMTSLSEGSHVYYEKGSEEAVSETALTINRLEQVSQDKRIQLQRFITLESVHKIAPKKEMHPFINFFLSFESLGTQYSHYDSLLILLDRDVS
jgi:hypothetical protein